MEERDVSLELLTNAAAEISRLRQQNQIMAARLDVFDKMMLIFHTEPAFPNQGFSPDILSAIGKHLAEVAEAKTNVSV